MLLLLATSAAKMKGLWLWFLVMWNCQIITIAFFDDYEAVDILEAEELRQLLVPFNVASKARISATSTCGEKKPTTLCYLHSFTGVRNDSECDECDATDPIKSHPPTNAIDGEKTFWASEIGPKDVNVTIDLRQHFYISSVVLKMGPSLPPRNWILEKSLDGVHFTPWQYFVGRPDECEKDFGTTAHNIPMFSEDVLCVTSHLRAKTIYGEVLVQLLDGRPGSRDFDHSSELQKWSDARYIRLHFVHPEAYGANLHLAPSHDDSFKRLIYYSLRDVTVFAYCICHGYSDSCTWNARKSMFICDCTRNTCGDECAECCHGFPQHVWRPFTPEDSSFSCERCNCFDHSIECVYNATVDVRRMSLDLSGQRRGGGQCLHCKNNTTGINCEQCLPGYYRPLSAPKTAGCEDCKNCTSILVQETSLLGNHVSYMTGLVHHLHKNPDVVFRRRIRNLEEKLYFITEDLVELMEQYAISGYISRRQKIDDLHVAISNISSQTWNIMYATTTAYKLGVGIATSASHISKNEATKVYSELSRILDKTEGLLNDVNMLSRSISKMSEDVAVKEAGKVLSEIYENAVMKTKRKVTVELLAAKTLYKTVAGVCQGEKEYRSKCEEQEKTLLNLTPRIDFFHQLANNSLMKAEVAKQMSIRNKVIKQRIKGHVQNYHHVTYHLHQSLMLLYECVEVLNTANAQSLQTTEFQITAVGNIPAMEIMISELKTSIDNFADTKIKLDMASNRFSHALSPISTSVSPVQRISEQEIALDKAFNEAEDVARSIEVLQLHTEATKTRTNLLLNHSKGLMGMKGYDGYPVEVTSSPTSPRTSITTPKTTTTPPKTTTTPPKTTTTPPKTTTTPPKTTTTPPKTTAATIETTSSREDTTTTTESSMDESEEGSTELEDSDDEDDYSRTEPTTELTIDEPTTEPPPWWESPFSILGDSPTQIDSALQEKSHHVIRTALKQNDALILLQRRLKQHAIKVAEYKKQNLAQHKTIDAHQKVAKTIKTTSLKTLKIMPEHEKVGTKFWTNMEERLHKLETRLKNQTSTWQELLEHPCSKPGSILVSVCIEKQLNDYQTCVKRYKDLAESIKLKQQHHQFSHLDRKIHSLREKIEKAKKLARKFKGPVKFSSPGFMSPSLPDEVIRQSAITHIELRVMSLYEEGWLFTTSRQTAKSFYILLRLVESRLETCACLDKELKCTKPMPGVIAGKWFHVDLLRIGNRMTVTLNTNGSVNKTETLVWEKATDFLAFLAQPFYVGGIPESFKVNQSMKNDFDGAMTLNVNGYEVSLISSNEQTGMQQFHTHSSLSMYAPEWLVGFNGRGYHKLPVEYSSKPIEIEFLFRTFEDGAILIHMQSSRKFTRLSVWLRGGVVHLQYDDHQKKSVRLSSLGFDYNDGKWHHVEVHQSSNAWTLAIDQRDKIGVVSLSFAIAKLKSVLMVGGLDPHTMDLLTGSLQAKLKPLEGCITNVTVRGIIQNMHNFHVSKNATVGKCTSPTSKCACPSSRQTIALDYLHSAIDLATVTFLTNSTKSSILQYSLSLQSVIDVYQENGKVNIRVQNRHVAGRYYDRSDLVVNDGSWHIAIILLRDRPSLMVDDMTLDFKDQLTEPFFESQHMLYLGGDNSTCFKDVAVNNRILDLSGRGHACPQEETLSV